MLVVFVVMVFVAGSFFVLDNITQKAFAYGGGAKPDPRICGDKMCSEIPGGREAWEAENKIASLSAEVEVQQQGEEEDKEQSNVSESKVLSPRKQMASGIEVNDVVCDVGLTLMQKITSGAAACVKPSSAMRLEELGWGTILKEPVMETGQEIVLREGFEMKQN